MPDECNFAAFRTHMRFLRPHHDVSGYHYVVIMHRQTLAESNLKTAESFWNFCNMCTLIKKFCSVHFDTCFQGIIHYYCHFIVSQLHFLVSDNGAYQWQEKCHKHKDGISFYCNMEFKKKIYVYHCL